MTVAVAVSNKPTIGTTSPKIQILSSDKSAILKNKFLQVSSADGWCVLA